MKTRYEMTKLFSVERDFDGNIKVIAGNTTKTYKNLPIATVSLIFGLSELVARSADLFEKYVKPEEEGGFSDRMLRMVDQVEKDPGRFSSITYGIGIGRESSIMSADINVSIDRAVSMLAHAMTEYDETFDSIIHHIVVNELIKIIK